VQLTQKVECPHRTRAYSFILLAKTYFTEGDISKKNSEIMKTVFVQGIFIVPHKNNLVGVRSGDLGGQSKWKLVGLRRLNVEGP
jgi:hypothetical protein